MAGYRFVEIEIELFVRISWLKLKITHLICDTQSCYS